MPSEIVPDAVLLLVQERVAVPPTETFEGEMLIAHVGTGITGFSVTVTFAEQVNVLPFVV